MKSTNYFNTLIEIAEDCPATAGEIPPIKGDKRSVANLEFEMLHGHPYEFTSDDVLFAVHATRKEIPEEDLAEARAVFFSKGQPCFRAAPLTKRYGWGIHSDESGKIAMFGVESPEYERLVADESVIKTKAMRSKR
ncbi:MAG: hypothetical protein KBG20_15955 [Caldilineaceae bacterium]|nr:hypothetical protein [Caldilineaceae bacterium]MBP8108701.1 hypothetical protein [Caldilineaceae bacterium]MBP8121044.1 hypothetical protein [Caldilineaceae bacterium]MBP9073802.1 hypothetical protein [Caldilineaceae bacterium]